MINKHKRAWLIRSLGDKIEQNKKDPYWFQQLARAAKRILGDSK